MLVEDGFQKVRFVTSEDRFVVRCKMLIDGTGKEPITNAAIVIEQGRIVDVVSPDRGVTHGETIDARQRVVMPGLIDAHVHLDGQATFDAYRRYLTPRDGVKIIRAAAYAQRLLQRGFTSIRDIGSGFGGDVKRAIADGSLAGPRVLTAIVALTQTAGHGDWHALPYDYLLERRPRALYADGLEGCRLAVRFALREGADLIKVFLASGGVTNTAQDLIAFPNYSMEELTTIIAEARRMGARVAAHCVGRTSIEMAIEAGVDTIEHGMMETPDRQLLKRMAEAGIVLVPTLAIFFWVGTEGEKYGVFAEGTQAARSRLTVHRATVAMAHTLGVPLAVGTDNNGIMGESNNAVELQLLVEVGLSPMEAIVAGTRGSAQALGITDDVGTVEAGKKPDLLILTGNPIDDITLLQDRENISVVMRGPLN